MPKFMLQRFFQNVSRALARGLFGTALLVWLASFSAFSDEAALMPQPASSTVPAQPWRFAFVSDTHIFYPSEDHFDVVRAIASDMKTQAVSVALFGGDSIRGHAEDAMGLGQQYKRWLDAVSPLFDAGIPVYAVPGNHEKWGKSEADETAAWNQYIASRMPVEGRTDNPLHPGMEFCFNFKNALFIGLDEFRFTGGNDFPKMFRSFDTDWVKEQLAKRNKETTPHVFVFGHCPAFMADNQWPASYDTQRDQFWSLLEREHVTLYLAGHNHVYARTAIVSLNKEPILQQVIVGTGGGATSYNWKGDFGDKELTRTKLWNARSFGYLLVTVSGSAAHLEWHSYNRDTKLFAVADSADLSRSSTNSP
jgi:3',5'-cyclic AMP phosphodiesterase CpdA